VVDSRPDKGGTTIRRRRECESCGRRFTTHERVEEMLPLHEIDEVAYVRFASVYRSFKDINEFMVELQDLLKK
jgi:transcriptional regulator NrdR family protein